jgi:hypothetical protein
VLSHKKYNELESEHISSLSPDAILKQLSTDKKIQSFLNVLGTEESKNVTDYIKQNFEETKQSIYTDTLRKEKENLEGKAALLKTLDAHKSLFGNINKFTLLHSLGLIYTKGNIYHIHTNPSKMVNGIPFEMPNDKYPSDLPLYVSPGFVNQNQIMLNSLFDIEQRNTNNETALFLPLIFQDIYRNLDDTLIEKSNANALSAYYNESIASFPKQNSFANYLDEMNAKGFYMIKEEEKIKLKSIYTSDTGIDIDKEHIKAMDRGKIIRQLMNLQIKLFNESKLNPEKPNLQDLWAAHLIEKGIYDKAAFLMIKNGAKPPLSSTTMAFHIEKGLGAEIVAQRELKLSSAQEQGNKRMAFKINALLSGSDKNRTKQAYNGFKDELTDYSKGKGMEL